MSDIDLLLVLIPGLPLSAAVVTAVFGKHVLGRQSHWPTVLAITLSLAASVVMTSSAVGLSTHSRLLLSLSLNSTPLAVS